MEFNTLDAIPAAGKTVLLRADLNVPVGEGGRITDSTRIDRLLPTCRELLDAGARLVIMSHFGRPKGQPNPDMSLEFLAKPLAAKLGVKVTFIEDCVGEKVEKRMEDLKDGEIFLLENLRFHGEEEANDEEFARALASIGELYVNDAFSTAHRAHASTHALAYLLPAYAGRLMEAEINALNDALEKPAAPSMAVVGGAKISTKLSLLKNLVGKLDMLALGGGMANTFLFARGVDVGASLCENDMADAARDIMQAAEDAGCDVLLPVDAVVAREFKADAENETVEVNAVPGDAMILDIGPKTVALLEGKLDSTKTVLWNGPMGAFEIEPFDAGTTALARAVAAKTADGLVSVAGGGDTVSALAHAGVVDDFTYVSTAGGAFLEWLEGKALPGIQALCENAGDKKARQAVSDRRAL